MAGGNGQVGAVTGGEAGWLIGSVCFSAIFVIMDMNGFGIGTSLISSIIPAALVGGMVNDMLVWHSKN